MRTVRLPQQPPPAPRATQLFVTGFTWANSPAIRATSILRQAGDGRGLKTGPALTRVMREDITRTPRFQPRNKFAGALSPRRFDRRHESHHGTTWWDFFMLVEESKKLVCAAEAPQLKSPSRLFRSW